MNDDWDGIRQLVESAVGAVPVGPTRAPKRKRRTHARIQSAVTVAPAPPPIPEPVPAPSDAEVLVGYLLAMEARKERATWRAVGWAVIGAVWVLLIVWATAR